MTSGFIYAIVILGLPALVLAAGVAACLRSHDDATRALSLPFAYACIVVCGIFALRLGIRGQALTAATVGPALVAGCFLLFRRGLRGLSAWPLLGAAITLAILASPYRWLKPGVLGWNIGNDSVIHATYADALAMPDRAPIAGSSAAGVIDTFTSGYPVGSHTLLASVLAFTRDPLTTFNPALAVMMAFAAFPAYWLIRRQLTSAPLAGIGAAVAAGGYLQLGFYSQGFMPQLAVTALLFGALGLGYEALAGRSLVLAAMAGVTAAASVLVYSAAIGVYLAPAALIAVVALVCMRSVPWRRRLLLPAVALGAALVAVAPELGRTLTLAQNATGSATSSFTGDRGNLPNAVDPLTSLGAWIGPDYRVSIVVPPTHLAMVAVVFLATLAVLVALWRSRFSLPAILAVTAVGAAYVSSSAGIYYTAKTYQVAAFPIACAAVAGAGVMARAPWPRLALPLALAGGLLLGIVAVAVKQGTGFAGRAAAVTPPEYRQLWSLGKQTPRQLGLMLIRDDWAKALLPDAATPYDGTFGANVRPGGRQVAGFIDVDTLEPASLRLVHWIVEPALASVSTPPRPFRLDDTVPAYRLWTRSEGSAPPPSRALPLEPRNTLGGIVLAPGQTVAAPASGRLQGRAVDGALAFPVQWKLTGSAWGPWVALPDFVVPNPSGGAPARTTVEIGAAGPYRVSLIGQPTLDTRVRVDGTTLPRPDPTAAGIYHFAPLGTVSLEPGRHVLSLIAPGNGAVAYILAVSLERVAPPGPVVVCIDGRRELLGPSRPVAVQRGQQISACGGRAALLDRITQAPAAP